MESIKLIQIDIKNVAVHELVQLLEDIEKMGYVDMQHYSYTYIGYDAYRNSYKRFALSIYDKRMLKDPKIRELLLEYMI